MKKIKSIKIFTNVLLILFIMFSMSISPSYASTVGEFIQGADNFIQTGEQQTKIPQDNLQSLSGDIYNILLAIGVVISVIVGIILGIQFMTGSVEQKSKVKETLIPYITGCVVIFGAFGIWKLIVTVLQGV